MATLRQLLSKPTVLTFMAGTFLPGMAGAGRGARFCPLWLSTTVGKVPVGGVVPGRQATARVSQDKDRYHLVSAVPPGRPALADLPRVAFFISAMYIPEAATTSRSGRDSKLGVRCRTRFLRP